MHFQRSTIFFKIILLSILFSNNITSDSFQYNSYNNHGVVGGRSKGTLITYSNGQLQSQQDYLQNMQRYKSYAILPPRTVRSYVDTGIAEAFRKMRDEGKYNCLVILYVDNVTQRDQWENGLENKIIEEFDTLSEYWDCKIEYEMLRYD